MLTAGDILNSKGGKIIAVGIESTIAEALEVMLQNKIGAILIKDGDDIKGIWTERDLMGNVVTDGFYSKTSRIKDYMTTQLISSAHSDSLSTS